MTRDDRGEYIEFWAEEELWDGLFETLTMQMPEAVLTMFIGGVTVIALYSWTESVTLPAVVLALFGGIVIALAPAPVAIILTIAVTIVVGLVLYAIYGRG